MSNSVAETVLALGVCLITAEGVVEGCEADARWERMGSVREGAGIPDRRPREAAAKGKLMPDSA